ncbi:MAG TPA: hypothetical protein VN408_27875 [Actinoplanes sp.]|nr:hypothetical protein [Actinoplanes sp.]
MNLATGAGGRLAAVFVIANLSQIILYGLFHPDGRTMADDETIYARIIAGEEHANGEMLIRNLDVPEGRILTVTGTRLLDEYDVPRAVIVFHDITAERRHRDELTAFAGVVAHDLQNSLTPMRGWTETAADALQEIPAHPMVAAWRRRSAGARRGPSGRRAGRKG